MANDKGKDNGNTEQQTGLSQEQREATQKPMLAPQTSVENENHRQPKREEPLGCTERGYGDNVAGEMDEGFKSNNQLKTPAETGYSKEVAKETTSDAKADENKKG